MKRTLSLILVFVMLLGMFPMSVFADEADTTFAIYLETDVTDPSALKINDTITVTAKIRNNPGFAGMKTKLTWDNSVVRFDGFETETYKGKQVLKSDLIDGEYNQTAGTVVVGESTDMTGDGMLWTAKFTVLKDGDAGIALSTDGDDFQMVNAAKESLVDSITIDQTALEGLTITHECDHKETVVDPTCTEGGYTEYKCACGDSYTANNTPALGHNYADGVCSTCGAEGTAIPEGAKFTDMLTDKGEIVTVTGKDGYYLVEVPYGTTSLLVTYPKDVPADNGFGYVSTRMTGIDGVTDDGYGKTTTEDEVIVGLALEKAAANGSPITIRLINLDNEYSKRVAIVMADGSEETFALTYKLGNGQHFAVLPVPESCIGYTVTGEAIASDGYSFNVSILEGYEATENFAVKVNGQTVATEPGRISIPSVTEDLKVTVEGVGKIAANTDITYTLDLTDCTGGFGGSMEYVNQGYQSDYIDVEVGKKNTLSLPASDNMMISIYLHTISPLVTGWDINGTVYEQATSYSKQSIGNGNTIYMDKGYFKMDNKGTEPCNMVVKPVLDTNHVHAYGQSVAEDQFLKGEATCESAAEYYKSCICGEYVTTAETFFDGETVLCSYEDGVCKWCGEAEPEPEETTSFFTVTLNDEAKTPVTLYQQGMDDCWNYGDTVKKLVVFVSEGTDSVCLVADEGLNVLYGTGDPEEPEAYLGTLVNPVLDLTQGYEYYGIWKSDWSDAIHLYFVEEEVHIHEYEKEVTPPTCTEGGYTTFTCKAGDDSYKGEYTSATGHTNVNGTCSTCGAPLTVIPEGAPFLEIVTSDGEIVTVTDMGTDPFFGMGKLYKVEVPLGTTQVNITLDQSKVYVDEFGYAKTMMQGFDNVSEDGYGQTTKDGKVTVGLQMEKTPANGSSSTIRLLNIPYPEDVSEVKAVGLVNATYDGLDFYAFTYKLDEGQYYANLPHSFMYTVTGDGVASNGYKFTVALKNGYKATEDFAVKVNGEVVATQPGEVTLASVTEDLTVTVEGVDKAYNAETDYSIVVDLSEFTGEVDGYMWLSKRSGENLEIPLVAGKKTSLTVDASDLWQCFANIYSLTPADGYAVVGYDINGEMHDSDGYMSYGCNFQSAAPGKYVIKPVVEQAEEKEPTLFTVTANGEIVTPEKGDPAECEQTDYEVNQYILILPAGTTSITLTDDSGLTIYEGCNGWPAICDGETSCTLTVSEEEKYYCLWNNAEGDDYYEVHLLVVVEEGSNEPDQPETGLPYTVTVNGENVELAEAGEDMCSGAYNVPKYALTLPAGATSFTINAYDGLFILKEDTDDICISGSTCTIECTSDTFYCVNGYRPDGSWFETHLYVTAAGSTEPEQPTVPGYTVTMPADITGVAVDETVEIPVVIGYNGDVTEYSAFDMTFTYDAEALELTSTEIEGMTVTAENGTVHVVRYGSELDLGEALKLTFQVKAAKNAEIKLTAAKVDISESALTQDAPDAIVTDDATQITVTGYTVTLGEGLAADSLTVAPGEAFTFRATDAANYDYTVKATIDGKEITVTDNGNGTYTIPADQITGNVTVTATMTAKSYTVKIDGVEQEQKAVYNTDYTFTPAKDGFTVKSVSVKIGGVDYTIGNPVDGAYTIPGDQITGIIEITVTWEAVTSENTSVNKGEGISGNETVAKGENYTFSFAETDKYDYSNLKVEIGEGENKTDITAQVTYDEATGTYTIPAALITGPITITVDRVEKNPLTIAVSEYLSLQEGSKMYLVTVSGVEEGKVAKYDGMSMYWSAQTVTTTGEGEKTTGYGAYAYLVISDQGLTAVEAEAAAKVTTAEGESAGTVSYTGDVNGTNKTDVNDAQLVYNMYNAVYGSFDEASMQKFLNADMNGDKTVNVSDAAAVVSVIVNNK